MALVQHLSRRTITIMGLGAAGIFSSFFLYLLRRNKFIATKTLGSGRKSPTSNSNNVHVEEPPLQMESIDAQRITVAKETPHSVHRIKEEEEEADVASPDHLKSRLTELSKSDVPALVTQESDGQVLSVCLLSSSEAKEQIRVLQLIGRLLHYQNHLEKISSGGVLVQAVCTRLQDSQEEEVQLHALLCLVNLAGLPSNHSSILTSLPAVSSCLSSKRLAGYSLQVMGNLALKEETHEVLISSTGDVISTLSSAIAQDDERVVKQALVVLVNISSVPSSCQTLLKARIKAEDFVAPVDMVAKDTAVKRSWTQLLTNLSADQDFLMRNAHLLPMKEQGEASLASVLAWQAAILSTQIQKVKDKLKRAEKSSEFGQQVSALCKTLKSLAKQSKSISTTSAASTSTNKSNNK